MIVEQRFERATSGLGLCERRQSGLNVFSDCLASLIASLIKSQMLDRTQGAALPVRPGDDPSFVTGGLHAKNQTTNLSIPELVGAISGLRRKNDAFGEGG